ncbi:MAG: LPS export ABC transporter periplasmic protein LptC [Hahellaceae bacterium]|nr:LPS export ABC transporter periplasmic protein LptC [Hahellaceae bacterium]
MKRHPLTQKRWISLVTTVVTVGLFYLLSEEAPLQLFNGEDQVIAQEPDAFVLNATYLTFDKNGQLRTRLRSEKAVHFPATDQGQLTNPHLIVYPEQGAPWEITSQQGLLFLQEDKLELAGFVTVVGEQPPGKALRFDSPTLQYDDKTRFIRTDQPVTINSQFNQLSAVGMEFEVDKKILRLFSRVEGVYVNP